MGTEDDELRARAQARIGSTLGEKYRLDRVLGVGGMAVVYAATHRNRNRVAVKVLHSELALDSFLRSRFAREGYVANTVEHPGTVRVLDDDVDEAGAVFLVMELLDGETLDARWERSGRRLGAREVAILMRDLLDVLAAAHAKGVVHRDIKPENLFITREGVLKVLDFGVARLREASPTATRSGRVFGTPAFMPPEQALGRSSEVDALSDVWAVGATAFTLLSGRLVHEGQTAEELLVYAATRPARPLAPLVPSVPMKLAAIVERALAFEKAERWPSAQGMRDALAALLEALDASPIEDDGALDWNDERTRVTAPPQMTVRDSASPTAESLQSGDSSSTLGMPALPISTVVGVASHSVARRIRARFAVLIGVGLVGGTATIIALLMTGARTQTAGPSVAPVAATGLPSATVTRVSVASTDDAGPAPPVLPIVQVESLPRAATTAPPSSTATTARTMLPSMAGAIRPPPSSAPAASASIGATKPGCSEPFVIDGNGVKRWKIECL